MIVDEISLVIQNIILETTGHEDEIKELLEEIFLFLEAPVREDWRFHKRLMINRSMNSHLLSLPLLGLVFSNSIHLEVASDSFCLLITSSWLLVFILYLFFIIFSQFNLYLWKGIH